MRAHDARRARRLAAPSSASARATSSTSSTCSSASPASGPSRRSACSRRSRPAQIAEAVQREDDAAFRKVSGIGPKTAKLIIVSLAGKLVAPAAALAAAPSSRAAPPRACSPRSRASAGPSGSPPRPSTRRWPRRQTPRRPRCRRCCASRSLGSGPRSSRGGRDDHERREAVTSTSTDPVLASEAELAFEGALRPKSLERVRRADQGPRAAAAAAHRCDAAAAHARPHPARGPARPRQDHPRDDRRPRGRPSAAHVERSRRSSTRATSRRC